MQRLEALKPEMAITEHNAALIAKICVQLEGIPLALELAATRCKLLSIQELAAFLDQGLEVLPKILSGGKHDLPTRQQSLNNTIAWSYHLLSHDEQTLFRRLCIFEGPFSLIEARAVALAPGEPGLSMLIMDGCASLINQSLLQQHEETVHGPRLSISKMIRAYGLEQLAEAGELEVCQKAYAAYKRVTSEYSTLQPIAALPEKLTSREIEVLRLLAMGLSNNQIAKRLVLSPFTVNRHAQSIYGKLGVNSRCAATRLALEHHLL
jgi:predicted ATPase